MIPAPAPAPIVPAYNVPVTVPAPVNLYQSVAAPPVYQAAPQVFNPAPIHQAPLNFAFEEPAPVASSPVYNIPSSYQPQLSNYQVSAPQFAPASFPTQSFQSQPQVSTYQSSAPQFAPSSFQPAPQSFAPRNVEFPQSPQAFRQQPQFSSPIYRPPPSQYQPLPLQGGQAQPITTQLQSQEQPKDVKDEINDLDKRVRDAIKNSEEAIKRNAGLPAKNA